MLFGNGKDDYILIYIIQITHTHKHLYRYIYFFFCLRTEFSYKSLGNLVLRTQKKHMRVCALVFLWQLKIIDHILHYASPLSAAPVLQAHIYVWKICPIFWNFLKETWIKSLNKRTLTEQSMLLAWKLPSNEKYQEMAFIAKCRGNLFSRQQELYWRFFKNVLSLKTQFLDIWVFIPYESIQCKRPCTIWQRIETIRSSRFLPPMV